MTSLTPLKIYACKLIDKKISPGSSLVRGVMKVALGKLWYSVLMDGAAWLKRAEMLGLKGGGQRPTIFAGDEGDINWRNPQLSPCFSSYSEFFRKPLRSI